jgi:hypothetical protein
MVHAAMRGLGQRMCKTFSQLMVVDSGAAETAAAALQLAGAALSAAGSEDSSLEQLHLVCSVTNKSCVQVAMLLKDCSCILIQSSALLRATPNEDQCLGQMALRG